MVERQEARAALAVMEAHIKALNARDEAAIAATLHFPHFRLSEAALKVWEAPESYFADFRARAGSDWARSSFENLRMVQASPSKVHLEVEVHRYGPDGMVYQTFPSLWVITQENGRWAAKFRSSFAPV